MPGYMNRILRVDLTNQNFSEETLSNDLIENYVGGAGFGVKLLYDDLKPGIDPMGEENELIFIAGPLAGTRAQSFGRWKTFFKSPLTGGYFKSSGGGYFAPELKFAGFDAVIIKGISPKPVYLWNHDGKYELRDAGYLWGLDSQDTQTLIRVELHNAKIRIACIGPAGEKLVKYAGIFSDRRAAARGGGGAVMGIKNLKAIAVRGTAKVDLADPAAFMATVKEQVTCCKNDPHFATFSERGTQNPEFTNILGIFPTRNFREGELTGWEKIESEEWDKLRVRSTRCHNCMLHCGSLTKVEDGPYKNWWSEGPEYETIWAFTGAVDSNDIGLSVAADNLCDELGLDTISTGVAIGFAYELFEKGIIDRNDTGGLELVYGQDAPVLTLIRQIADRDGFGDILAEGVRAAADRIGKGAQQYAMQVKGLEIAGYDPRGAKAHGLNMMTTNIGADHCSGYAGQEIFGVPYFGKEIDRFAVEGKGELTKFNQDIRMLYGFGIMCNFASRHMDPGLMGRYLTAATGNKTFEDPDYLWHAADRAFNLERMFNVREGFGRKDDVYPARFSEETMTKGSAAGYVFEAETLLADYYQARGWDADTGIPKDETLTKLGLEACIGK